MIDKLFAMMFFVQAVSYAQDGVSLRLDQLAEGDSKVRIEKSEDKGTATVETEQGKVQVSCEVEEADFASECRAEWNRMKEGKQEDDKDSRAGKAKVEISWSTKK